MKKLIVIPLIQLLIILSGLSAYASPSFSDVKNHWAKESINHVVELGLMKGYANNTFGPKKNVSREELAAILSRMVENFDARLTEVPADVLGRWSEPSIAHVMALNLIQATDGNSFAPKQFATRQEVAHAIFILMELHQIPLNGTPGHLNDISGTKYQQDIRAITSVGLMGGDANGNFFPNKNITRAELAAVLVRVSDTLRNGTTPNAPQTPTTVQLVADPQNVKLINGTKYIDGKFNRELAYKVLALVNEERKKEGLGELQWSDELQVGTDIRAVEIVELFAHNRPDGTSCFTLDTGLMAENIAMGHTSAEHVVRDWMNSPGHRANIMKAGHTKMAVSLFIDSGGVTQWAQHFS